MLTAVIENNGNTLVLDFPKSRPILDAELASIEIQELAHEIYLADAESMHSAEKSLIRAKRITRKEFLNDFNKILSQIVK